ncbi:anti-sigma factor [Halobacillus sp. BBL2006]|uniref:anti-sigma factor n=1 Tax=Halobacillus sp. BBL2006 TaxID=1543706 RepID=UPI000AFFB77E|nr:anti-sigma factor [Halobacillus sp. BBL2006]
MRNECDKLIDYFNDQLTETEKEKFEKHLETCADCREELEELRMLTADLPFASEPVDPPEDMKDRVLGSVFSEESPKNTEEIADQPPKNNEKNSVIDFDKKKAESTQEEKPWRKKPVWLIRGLVAALVLSIAGNLFALIHDNEEAAPEPDPTETPGEEDGTDQVMKRVQLQGEATNATASAALVQQQAGDVLTLQAEQLDQLQGDEVYQVWLIQGETPYRAGTFVANENGEGAVSYSMKDLPEDVKWDAVAISKEPDATSQTPQGEVILSSEL